MLDLIFGIGNRDNKCIITFRKHNPSDEDYDYDLKGLPVRKRRNINYNNKYDVRQKDRACDKPPKMIDEDLGSESKLRQQNILTSPSTIHEVDDSYDSNNTDSRNTENEDEHTQESINYGLNYSTKVPEIQNLNGTMFQNIFTHIVTKLELIKKMLSESSQQSQTNSSSSRSLSERDNNDSEMKEVSRNISTPNLTNSNFNSPVNLNLSRNRTKSFLRDLNYSKEVSMEPLFIQILLPTAA